MVDTLAFSPFDSGIHCLCIVARFFNVPSNPAQLIREFTPSHDNLVDANVIRAAKHIGLKAKQTILNVNKLVECPLPAIGQHQDGHYFVIAKVMKEGQEFLIHDLATGKPEVLDKDALAELWALFPVTLFYLF